MPTTPNYDRPQFSLFGLLALTSLFCIVFALLAAVGAPPTQALVGFILFTGVAATTAVVVEIFSRLIGARGRS